MKIRLFRNEDGPLLAKLFHETIRKINIKDYGQAQVEAWAPELTPTWLSQWESSFAGKTVFVAESNQELAGFAELEINGHIDRFYVGHRFIRQGVGFLLFRALQECAREQQLSELSVEASVTAEPFFRKMGFSESVEQEVERNGEIFKNYKMTKKWGA